MVDQTGLAGNYEIRLMASWELPGASNPDGAARIVNAGAPSIFRAVQEQLGLKLDRKRIAVEFVHVDHAERPSEN